MHGSFLRCDMHNSVRNEEIRTLLITYMMLSDVESGGTISVMVS